MRERTLRRITLEVLKECHERLSLRIQWPTIRHVKCESYEDLLQVDAGTAISIIGYCHGIAIGRGLLQVLFILQKVVHCT